MPNQENLVFILTVVASIASILSVPIAIAQTIRIRRLNVEKKLKVWTQISSIKAQMRLLEAEKIETDRKSTRLNSSHLGISYAVFCLKKKKNPIYSTFLSPPNRPLSPVLSICRAH